MDKAKQKSIEWQKANHPMAIGGDAFADMVDSFNVNPAYIAGYKDAQKDLALTWEDIMFISQTVTEIINSIPDKPCPYTPGLKEICEETLKRFNEQREKK